MKALKQLKRTSLYSNALMALTSLHHIYGALIYGTPWRLHAIVVSIPVILLTVVLEYLLQRYHNKYLFWLYSFVILIPSISLIGLFEGVYNHVLKNIMFYLGVDKEVMLQMFPPPKYEMPNDFIFEFTGVLQGVLCAILSVSFYKFLVASLNKSVQPASAKR